MSAIPRPTSYPCRDCSLGRGSYIRQLRSSPMSELEHLQEITALLHQLHAQIESLEDRFTALESRVSTLESQMSDVHNWTLEIHDCVVGSEARAREMVIGQKADKR